MDERTHLSGLSERLPELPSDGPVTGHPSGGGYPTVDLTRAGRRRLAEDDEEKMAEDDKDKEEAAGKDDDEKMSSRARRNMEERLAEQRRTHERGMERLAARYEMQRTLDAIDGATKSVRGEAVGDIKLKQRLTELSLEAMQTYGREAPDGKGKKDLEWFRGRVASFQKARFDEIQAAGNDGDPLSKGNLSLAGSGDRREDQFDVNRLLANVRRQALQREGGQSTGPKLKPFDGTIETLDGCREADVVRQLASRPNTDAQRKHESMRKYGPNALAIPVPWLALHQQAMDDHRFAMQHLAQTYGTDGDDTAENIFRRDLLVPYFRPLQNLAWLGATTLMIANNITVPVLTDSIVAQWEGETDDAMEDALVIGNVESAPKRLAAMDTIAWMLLAAADEQFGMQPLVVQELLRAVMQAEERAAYVGSGASGQPRGAWNYTGIQARTNIKLSNPASDSFKELLSIPDLLAVDNIDGLEEGAFVTTHGLKTSYKTVLNFATSVASVPLFQQAVGGDPMMSRTPAGRGVLVDYPAVATTQMPSVATDAGVLTGGTNHTLLFGVWRYLLSISYSVAFLTVDDISQAHKAQTRVIVNKFCDTLNRLPSGFARAVSAPVTM